MASAVESLKEVDSHSHLKKVIQETLSRINCLSPTPNSENLFTQNILNFNPNENVKQIEHKIMRQKQVQEKSWQLLSKPSKQEESRVLAASSDLNQP
jgi:hypothetical protein